MTRNLIFLLAASSLVAAQEMPELCLAGDPCPRPTVEPYPETGIWFNPEEPGSGFVFEVQNGILAGYYFGYDEQGGPVWYLISGRLELVEDDSVVWRLEAPLLRFQGGSCIGCPYTGPEAPSQAGEIELNFLTRATGVFSIDGQQWYRTQAFTYGSEGRVVFPGIDYPMPNLTGQWLMIVYDRDTEISASRQFAAVGTDVWITTGAMEPGQSHYLIVQALSAPEYQHIGGIECITSESGISGTCTVSLVQPPLEAKKFYMPATAISDSYFKAIADDEDTVEAFRVNYD